MPLPEYYKQKFGARAEELAEHIKAQGRADGAAFAHWEWRANTTGGHRWGEGL